MQWETSKEDMQFLFYFRMKKREKYFKASQHRVQGSLENICCLLFSLQERFSHRTNLPE